MKPIIYPICILAISFIFFPNLTQAGDGCAHCGCQAGCRKVCRLVREDKQVEVVCWGCKTEDFCVHSPSKPGCKHCETVCDFCNEGCVTKPKAFVWTDWIPGCATIHTRKKLMKRTITKTVPSYKWVVEKLCNQCEQQLPLANTEPLAPIPPSLDKN